MQIGKSSWTSGVGTLSLYFSRTQLLPLALSLKCLGENKGPVLLHLNKHQVPSSGAHLSPTSGWGGHILQLHIKLIDAFQLWCLNWCFNWCFWTVVLEKTLEIPLDCKKIQPVHPKGDQSWVFIGRNDAEAETPILWPPDTKSWLIWKDFDAGKDWRLEEKGMTDDEMVEWHHRLNGHEFK